MAKQSKKSQSKKETKKEEQKEKDQPKEPKRVYRSRDDRILAGVCGGLAEHFQIDPIWVRLVFVLTAFLHGIGVLIYLVAWILIPENPKQKKEDTQIDKALHTFAKKKTKDKSVVFGAILIIVGLFIILDNLIHWFEFWYVFPLGMICLGIYLIKLKE